MRKLINTLLLGLLCLNLYAQATPLELLQKLSIPFIQKQLLSNYPILGEEQDVKKWLGTYAYAFRLYSFQQCVGEPCHFFKSKVDSFLGVELIKWTSFRVQFNEKQPQKLDLIVNELYFATPESKAKVLLKIWETLDSVGVYEPDNDVKTGLFGNKYDIVKYDLKEGTLIIETAQDSADTTISIGFKLNSDYGTTSGLQKVWVEAVLRELPPFEDDSIKKQ